MVRTRWVAAATALVTLSVGGLAPADAGAPPGTFNDAFTSLPITVNGSYTPLIGGLDCTSGGGNLAIIWYAPGSVPDHRWTNLDTNDSGDLEHSTGPLTINGAYARPFVGDFDADGCDDVFWYAPGPGADFVWYGVPDGGFTSRAVVVNGSYAPLVGDWDGGTPGDDIFWYADEGGTETIWRGTATRGTFGKSSGPQVSGTDYRVSSFGNGVLFHRPGTGADYIWEGIVAGETAPGNSVQVTINLTYEPYFADGILLYGPGTAPDKFIWSYSPDGSLDTLDGTVNGTYRVAVPAPTSTFEGLLLFHAPGAAPDYLWVRAPSMPTAAGSTLGR